MLPADPDGADLVRGQGWRTKVTFTVAVRAVGLVGLASKVTSPSPWQGRRVHQDARLDGLPVDAALEAWFGPIGRAGAGARAGPAGYRVRCVPPSWPTA
jgi:hypothetical protein